MIPDPEPLPALPQSASPEELAQLVQKQADLRRQIKQEKAERVVAGGRGRGRKGEGRGKGKNKGEEVEVQAVEAEAKRRPRKRATGGEVERQEVAQGAAPSKRKKVEDGKEKANPGFLTPFKEAPKVKVRNPYSPGQRRVKRESKSQSALLKLKRQKNLLSSLKSLPLLDDETKMSFGLYNYYPTQSQPIRNQALR